MANDGLVVFLFQSFCVSVAFKICHRDTETQNSSRLYF